MYTCTSTLSDFVSVAFAASLGLEDVLVLTLPGHKLPRWLYWCHDQGGASRDCKPMEQGSYARWLMDETYGFRQK